MEEPIEYKMTSEGLHVLYENSAYDHTIKINPTVNHATIIDDHLEYRFPNVKKIELVDDDGFKVLTTDAVDVQLFTRDGAETLKIIYRTKV